MEGEGRCRIRTLLAVLLTGLSLALCPVHGCCPREAEMRAGPETIEKVLARQTPRLMSISGVVGTGQGLCDGRPCIYVYVSALTPEARSRIPASLGGYPVLIRETGEIKSLQ
jgi:hypothetical protein